MYLGTYSHTSLVLIYHLNLDAAHNINVVGFDASESAAFNRINLSDLLSTTCTNELKYVSNRSAFYSTYMYPPNRSLSRASSRLTRGQPVIMIGKKVEQGYSETVAGAAQVIITTCTKDIHVDKTFITRLYVAT